MLPFCLLEASFRRGLRLDSFMSTARADSRPAVVALPTASRGLIWSLGLGAFGLAFSITTTAAYLPPVLGRFTDSRR